MSRLFRYSSMQDRLEAPLSRTPAKKVLFKASSLKSSQIRTASGFGGTGGGGTRGGGSFVGQPGGITTPAQVKTQTGNPLTDNSLVDSWTPIDRMGLHNLWRRVYLRDAIGGPATDFWKEIAWSKFGLANIKDKEQLQIFQDCLDALQILKWLPEFSAEFLYLGKACIHLLFDQSKGYWTNLIIHDPDHLEIARTPLINQEIKVDLKPNEEHAAFLASTDPRDIAARNGMDPALLRMMAQGQPIPLDPKNTLYLPRKAFAYDIEGISYYSRILSFIALEKTLFTASILAARRRAGPVTHIKVGDENFEPGPEQLDAMAAGWMDAEEDAVSAVIATGPYVEVNRAVSSIATDLWKISDEYEFIRNGKMQALGINDSILSGEASFNSMEMSLSIMLDRIRSHREFITESLIINKILMGVAKANGFVKRTQAELDHNIRIGQTRKLANNEENLIVPTINWHKSLRPSSDETMMNMLKTAEESGLPVGLRHYGAASGFDLDEAITAMPEDLEARKKVAEWQQKKVEISSAGQGGVPGMEGGEEGGFETGAAFKSGSNRVSDVIANLPIWDIQGKCVDVYRNEVIDLMRNQEFINHVIAHHDWDSVSRYLSGSLDYSPRKTEVIGYVLHRLRLTSDYKVNGELARFLAERARKDGLYDPTSLPMIRELQLLSKLGAHKEKIQNGHHIGHTIAKDEMIGDPNLLTGSQ